MEKKQDDFENKQDCPKLTKPNPPPRVLMANILGTKVHHHPKRPAPPPHLGLDPRLFNTKAKKRPEPPFLGLDTTKLTTKFKKDRESDK